MQEDKYSRTELRNAAKHLQNIMQTFADALLTNLIAPFAKIVGIHFEDTAVENKTAGSDSLPLLPLFHKAADISS